MVSYSETGSNPPIGSNRDSGQDIHHTTRPVLLQCNVVWLKKYGGNIPESSNQNVQAIAGKDHGGLY